MIVQAEGQAVSLTVYLMLEEIVLSLLVYSCRCNGEQCSLCSHTLTEHEYSHTDFCRLNAEFTHLMLHSFTTTLVTIIAGNMNIIIGRRKVLTHYKVMSNLCVMIVVNTLHQCTCSIIPTCMECTHCFAHRDNDLDVFGIGEESFHINFYKVVEH